MSNEFSEAEKSAAQLLKYGYSKYSKFDRLMDEEKAAIGSQERLMELVIWIEERTK